MSLKDRLLSPFPSRHRRTQTSASAPVSAAPSTNSSNIDVALGVTTTVLDTLRTAAQLSPVPLLGEAAGLSVGIFTQIQNAHSNNKSFNALAAQACDTVDQIYSVVTSYPGQSLPANLEGNLKELKSTLTSIENFAKKQASRGLFRKFYMAKADTDEVRTYEGKLRDALDLLVNKNVLSLALQVARNEEAQRVRDAEASIARAREHLRNLLTPVGFDIRHQCLKGTRQNILDEICDWAGDSNAQENILWISGSPGAGKSAIAASVVSFLQEQKQLAVAFYFKRGDAAQGNPASLWKTIAYELALQSFIIALKIGDIQNIGNSISEHYRHLIEQPLKDRSDKLAHLVVVVDALDECSTESSLRSDQEVERTPQEIQTCNHS